MVPVVPVWVSLLFMPVPEPVRPPVAVLSVEDRFVLEPVVPLVSPALFVPALELPDIPGVSEPVPPPEPPPALPPPPAWANASVLVRTSAVDSAIVVSLMMFSLFSLGLENDLDRASFLSRADGSKVTNSSIRQLDRW
jgi:hypothetical protein